MAIVPVRSEQAEKLAAPVLSEWEPLRLMRKMLSWDPFGEMVPLAAEERGLGFVPAFEIKETKGGYLFRADVPGVKEGDLEISVTGNRLTVSGKREAEKQEQTDRFYTYERSYGSFTRSFTLPESADLRAISAELKDGVLAISVARRPEMQPQKIQIKPTVAGPGAPKA